MSSAIQFEIQGAVAQLTLSAPERRNAIGANEIEQVKSALEQVSEDCRLFVIRSQGPVFCAGANLKEITDGVMDGDDFQSMTNAIAALPIPSLAIVEGDVFGGGAELLFSCDFRLGSAGKSLKIPAAAVDLCYPVEGIERMTQRLGGALVRKLLLTTEAITFEELAHRGAIDWLVESERVHDRAEALVSKLTGLAPLSVRAMLSIIKSVEAGSFDRNQSQELADQCSASHDLAEGLSAVRERRPPTFKGC